MIEPSVVGIKGAKLSCLNREAAKMVARLIQSISYHGTFWLSKAGVSRDSDRSCSAEQCHIALYDVEK